MSLAYGEKLLSCNKRAHKALRDYYMTETDMTFTTFERMCSLEKSEQSRRVAERDFAFPVPYRPLLGKEAAKTLRYLAPYLREGGLLLEWLTSDESVSEAARKTLVNDARAYYDATDRECHEGGAE